MEQYVRRAIEEVIDREVASFGVNHGVREAPTTPDGRASDRSSGPAGSANRGAGGDTVAEPWDTGAA